MSKIQYIRTLGDEAPTVETSALDDASRVFERVNPKAAVYGLGGLITIFVVFQSIIHDSPPQDNSVTTPDHLGMETFIFPEDPLKDRPLGNQTGSAEKFLGPQLIARPRDLKNIPPGSMLWARLVTGASNGLVRAEVTRGLSVAGDTKIPVGAVLVGNGTSTEERLFVRFSQVVFKDGTVGTIQAEACDKSDKIVGLKGSKVTGKALNVAGGIGLGFMSGFSEALQDTEGQQGTLVRKPTLKNALLHGTATTALEQSRDLLNDLKNQIPILEVPEGTELCAIFGGL